VSRPGRFLHPGKDPVPIIQEAGWAPGAENLAPTEIQSPDRPARPTAFTPRKYSWYSFLLEDESASGL
jgi:hypothetical protein